MSSCRFTSMIVVQQSADKTCGSHFITQIVVRCSKLGLCFCCRCRQIRLHFQKQTHCMQCSKSSVSKEAGQGESKLLNHTPNIDKHCLAASRAIDIMGMTTRKGTQMVANKLAGVPMPINILGVVLNAQHSVLQILCLPICFRQKHCEDMRQYNVAVFCFWYLRFYTI